MPGLVPGIHVLLFFEAKTWMAGTSPAMTVVVVRSKDVDGRDRPGHDGICFTVL
jgi:hypothetical protein